MNEEKGEVQVDFAGKAYIARPEFEAMANIEAFLNTGLLDLGKRAFQQKTTSFENAVVLYFCIRRGLGLKDGDEMPFDLQDFVQDLYKKGQVYAYTRVVQLLKVMLSGETARESEEKNEQPPVMESPQS